MSFFKPLRRKIYGLALAAVSQSGCSAMIGKRDPWFPFIYDSIRIGADESEKSSSLTLIAILLIGLFGAGIGIASKFRSRRKKKKIRDDRTGS